MPSLVCIDTGNYGSTKSSSRKKHASIRRGGVKATRKRTVTKCDNADGSLKPGADGNGKVAIVDGGVGKKAKIIPQDVGAPTDRVVIQQTVCPDTIHGDSNSIKAVAENESSSLEIAVNPDEGKLTISTITNTSKVNANTSVNTEFTLSGTDSVGNVISTKLKFIPMNDKSTFLAALKEKGIRYKPNSWKGPQQNYSLERGNDTTTKSDDGYMSNEITTLAQLFLNDDIQEMWELSFYPKMMTSSAPPTIDFRGVLSTQQHTVFVNGIKLTDGDSVSLKDSDLLHFFNHDTHPQFAFAFIVELSVSMELS
jgi:hypothetical protein